MHLLLLLNTQITLLVNADITVTYLIAYHVAYLTVLSHASPQTPTFCAPLSSRQISPSTAILWMIFLQVC
ncbi:hypothetical protein GB937_007995 [Aspergillus fischeri]|nr:hypothetical protein GB937_007995 [Aspergillus fischeri]